MKMYAVAPDAQQLDSQPASLLGQGRAKFSQIALLAGASDFGGTLISEHLHRRRLRLRSAYEAGAVSCPDPRNGARRRALDYLREYQSVWDGRSIADPLDAVDEPAKKFGSTRS
jgi:hypothetical protein